VLSHLNLAAIPRLSSIRLLIPNESSCSAAIAFASPPCAPAQPPSSPTPTSSFCSRFPSPLTCVSAASASSLWSPLPRPAGPRRCVSTLTSPTCRSTTSTPSSPVRPHIRYSTAKQRKMTKYTPMCHNHVVAMPNRFIAYRSTLNLTLLLVLYCFALL